MSEELDDALFDDALFEEAWLEASEEAAEEWGKDNPWEDEEVKQEQAELEQALDDDALGDFLNEVKGFIEDEEGVVEQKADQYLLKAIDNIKGLLEKLDEPVVAPTPQPEGAPTPSMPSSQVPVPPPGGAVVIAPVEIEKEEEKLPPFDPRLPRNEGSHRNAYLTKDTTVPTKIVRHKGENTPLAVNVPLVLNSGDSVRVSQEDISKKSYERKRDRFDPNQKDTTPKDYPVRMAMRRGWFWYIGEVGLDSIFLD